MIETSLVFNRSTPMWQQCA